MTSHRSTLTNLSKRESSLHVELGDDARYAVKGVGSTSFQLDSRDILHMSDIVSPEIEEETPVYFSPRGQRPQSFLCGWTSPRVA